MDEQQIELYQKRDLGQTLIAAIQIVKSNPKHFFKTAVLMVLPLFLATSTLSFLKQNIYDPSASPYDRIINEFLGPMNILSLIASYLYTASCTWAAVYFLKLYRERGSGNFEMADLWSEVFKHGWKLLFAFIAVVIITSIVVVVAGFFASITLVLIPFFYVAMLLVFNFLLMFSIIYLNEEAGFSNSIDRVFKLMKGRWFSSVGLLIVCILIPFSVIFSPVIITAIIDIDSFREVFDLTAGLNVSFTLLLENIMQILGLLYLLLLNLSFAVFYFSLSEEKDHVSLKKRVEDLGPLGTYQ
ncbi:MAG: hypothetical protein EP332_04880 [Bacteroidetes bacterium]|nr:MAG: hypothetical protein EP332_04880 [Bacteroidota bacterium]